MATGHGTEAREPLYHALARQLRTQVLSSGPTPLRLPTEDDLCKIHNVSAITVRKALSILTSEKLIVRIRRRGTFSVPPSSVAPRPLRGQLVGINLAHSRPTSFPELEMQGIMDFLEQRGIHLVLKSRPVGVTAVPRLIADIISSGLAGFIWQNAGDEMNAAIAAAAAKAGIHMVFCDTRIENPPVDYVTCDNVLGGSLVAGYLADLGHQRLAYVSMVNTVTARDRWQGFLDQATRRAAEAVCFASWQGQDNPIERFLGQASRFTAVFCVNDGTAALVMRPLIARGLRVPDDISIVGYDNDMEVCASLQAPLTSVAQPAREMGVRASQLLWERMSGMGISAPRHVELAPTLVARCSTAPPRKGG